MNSERWQLIENLFHRALDLSPEERQSYLTEVCVRDESLREELESLISSFSESEDFLAEPLLPTGLRVLAQDDADLVAGDELGNYRILSELGRGGMGSVYLAVDSRLGRKVALKVLSQRLLTNEPRLRRFRQEARAASKISHPNVAAIFEIGSFADTHFIAMEFVDGDTLRNRLSQYPLPLKDTIDIVIQVGLALESAHEAGIVHRDIKPENIMLRRDGYVKVLDFGLAKLTEAYQENSLSQSTEVTPAIPTEPGLVMGTIAYMSPEQARGLDVDPRTDVWSWGVVLYEAVFGQPPFTGETTSDLMADILRGEPQWPERQLSQIPLQLKDVLRRALAKDKAARYANMKEALADLHSAQVEIERGVDPPSLTSESKSSQSPRFATLRARPTDLKRPNQPLITGANERSGFFRRTGTAVRRTLSLLSSERPPASLWTRVPAVVLITLFAVIALAVILVRRLPPAPPAPPSLQFSRLSSEGNILEAAISRDGKYIASWVDENDTRSLWVRQTNTSANLQIIPPSHEFYSGLSFSPDGDNIYYLENANGSGTLYSVSVLGGAPRKLSQDVDTPVTFTSDGRRMAFVRQDSSGISALITANADGTDQKTLAELKRPLSFTSDWQYSTGPAWSPDGKVIACPTIDETNSSRVDVVAARADDGATKRINIKKGFLARVRKLLWLSDSSGLIMIARDQNTSPHQLWYLSYGEGETKKITNDADEYVGLSGTDDGSTLLTTKINAISNLWVTDATSASRQISSTNHDGGNGISWTPDGRIVYTRNVGSSSDLWIMNSNGSDRRQLTFDGLRNMEPSVSPDGRYVAFVSFREGKPHVWRIAIDGTDPKQLTNGGYEDEPIFSRDGKQVIYHRLDPSGWWTIPIDGGETIPLLKKAWPFMDVSRINGLLASIEHSDGAPWRVTIAATDGSPRNTFDISSGFQPSLPGIRWMPDGSGVTYVLSKNGVSNIWSQSYSGGEPQQLTTFAEGQILYFAWSVNGQLACTRGTSTKDLFLVRNYH